MVKKKLRFPKITIVTPSYNQAEFLERTIQSVLNQEYPNLEYIVVDGASSDDSVKIIKKYQKKLSYWVSKKDGGQTDAINKGFQKATGQIMGWLNSDDVLLPGSLFLIAKIFSEHPEIEWITGQPISINSQDMIVRTGIQSGRLSQLIRLGLYHGKGLGFIGQEGTFWTKELWLASGKNVPNFRYAMDFHLWQKFAQFADLVSIESPLGAFRLNPIRKTKTLVNYYNEIWPLLNVIPKPFLLFFRILHPLFLRKISPRIYFDDETSAWVFSKGYFFTPNLKKGT